tara:strand:- start:721 stop:978 length:258 start_codon:yes stop_codon:yes gene_type:complete
MAAPPPKTFADLAEAKEAMGKLIKTLNDNRTELEELIKAADGDQVSRQPWLVTATIGRADTSVLRMRQLLPCPLHMPRSKRRCRR